jgi:hypothetical protein
MPYIYNTCAGSIRGLFLPPSAWEVLRRENIQTMDQLRTHADRLEQFDGINAGAARSSDKLLPASYHAKRRHRAGTMTRGARNSQNRLYATHWYGAE